MGVAPWPGSERDAASPPSVAAAATPPMMATVVIVMPVAVEAPAAVPAAAAPLSALALSFWSPPLRGGACGAPVCGDRGSGGRVCGDPPMPAEAALACFVAARYA